MSKKKFLIGTMLATHFEYLSGKIISTWSNLSSSFLIMASRVELSSICIFLTSLASCLMGMEY